MKKGQIFEGIVKDIKFPNKGMVQCFEEDREYLVVVKGTVPGQKIRFSISKKKSGKYEGRLLDVIEKSPLEDRSIQCSNGINCGGCTYQCVSYQNQLKLKEKMVKDILDNVIDDYEFEGILESPDEWNYRNKMEFTFGDECKDGELALGLHKKGSFYDILTIEDCKIVNDDYNKIVGAVLGLAKEEGQTFYHKMRHVGFLRHLLIRRAVVTGEILVDIVTSSQETEESLKKGGFCQRAADRIQKLNLSGKLCGILHTVNDSLSDTVQSDKTEIIYGRDYIYEEILGLRFKISVFSFFQTNSLGAEVLYRKVREYVGDTKGKLVYDLYSGTGTIAQMLAAVADKVVGVEIVDEAVDAARENAKLNKLNNCEFVAGDVLKVLDELTKKPDFIVLDPPRDGIHPKALPKIIDYGVDSMVYISCKPTSLARDLQIFTQHGYKVIKACAVDMFPGTGHVETVVLLSKGVVDSRKVKVDFSLEDMNLSEFIGKATYEQIKAYVLEHTGLKVSSLYIAQIKKKCGLDVGENFNLPKSENTRQPQCTPEKEEAIMQAFKHFGIV